MPGAVKGLFTGILPPHHGLPMWTPFFFSCQKKAREKVKESLMVMPTSFLPSPRISLKLSNYGGC